MKGNGMNGFCLTRTGLNRIVQVAAIVVFIWLLLISTASATSWVKLQPDEILRRSTVIVEGTYQLSVGSKRNANDGLFTAYNFNAQKYYRGNGPQMIEAGVNGFDVGWVKQHQENGGTFLLFLEPGKQFLIPVGGPNGMVTMSNGKITGQSSGNQQKFEQFLAGQRAVLPTQEGVDKALPAAQSWMGSDSKVWMWTGIGAAGVIVGAGVWFLKWRSKKDQTG